MPGLPSRARGRPAVRYALAAVCLAAAGLSGSAAPAPADPQEGARRLFQAAAAREEALRQALAASPPGPAPTRDAIRQVVAAYRQVVLQYPRSGYCDDALWLGAQLLAEAFSRYGNDQDRASAVTLLTSLAREYPSSSLAARARAEAARLRGLAAPAAPAADAGQAAPAPPGAAAASSAPRGRVLVRDIRRLVTPGGASVEVELDGPVQFREQRLDQPPRLFVDLANTHTMDALRDASFAFESGAIKRLRVGRHPNDVTRIVIETGAATRCSSRLASAPYRVIISCDEPAVQTGVPAVGSVAEPAAADRPPEPARAPVQPADPGPRGAAPAPPPTPAPAVRPESPAAPSANGRGGYSMARQLGLRVGRIVIDAGHGGRDPGAAGPGFNEADLTLDVALRLEKLLSGEPGIEVVLTRRTDEFVELHERTAIANRAGADLFVSIHANASRNRNARGVECYLLNFASTPEAAAVAARENASSSLTMSHLNDLVKQIALNSKLDESRDLAEHLQRSLVRRLRASNQGIRDLGVKQAPFVVLVGASMPSVLVEVSFLTHRQEGRLLGTSSYRQRIAEAILDGIRGYLGTLKRVHTAAGAGGGPVRGQALEGLQ